MTSKPMRSFHLHIDSPLEVGIVLLSVVVFVGIYVLLDYLGKSYLYMDTLAILGAIDAGFCLRHWARTSLRSKYPDARGVVFLSIGTTLILVTALYSAWRPMNGYLFVYGAILPFLVCMVIFLWLNRKNPHVMK